MLPLPWSEETYTGNRNPRKTRTRFPCPRCRKSYTTKSAVTAHFKYDCGKPPRFECPYCGKLSKKKFNIQDHIRHKHPSKPNSSSIPDCCCSHNQIILCDRLIGPRALHRKKYVKKRDIQYNTNTGKFHCPNCNNGYGRRDTMLGHYRYECGKAPRYKCPYCNLCSKKTSNIYQHIRCMHPKEQVSLVKLY
ncbi:hypothetical protein HN011_011873 [Eciton burchellii]|nr:hypothetical protein HN011_011873 [Eciton burchellii]